ncbi:Hypothetical predicted protein [Paramuricea clavata]|uniref:Uncharacterized protein n=1 Tax=Paramuricea clavata TaxID=317549 RepID=A0A6S7H9A5_PARCT|nr:Hypothetical predicted protein [Paramuricea clavata]CAB3999609.1 Hypothetical predicted protein [Paramuricea clavata]
MNHQWHACCLNEEVGAEADVQLLEENDGISRCEREGENSCKCEKYFEGIAGQSCSEGRHNCDDSKTCYMNHQWHACCLNEEVGAEADAELLDENEGISRCEREGEDSCKCEKFFEGIPGQNCSEGRHNCDDSKTCYMNHQWHACCLNEEAGAEADVQLQDENDGISRCEREGEDSCKCEKYFEGIAGQNCSEGRHNCDDSKTCYMNHQWHACCLNEEEAATEAVLPTVEEDDIEGMKREIKIEDEAPADESYRRRQRIEKMD